jgi:hypothetical protein
MKRIENSKANTHSTARGGVIRPVKPLRGICIATGLAISLLLLVMASDALAATTPGWECVPTTAGQAVLSGGTGATPSCSSGTPVLAPTYVSSGVGGKPTVQLSGVNVQIVNGEGKTAMINGEGNLVIGYDENAGKHEQTGSHNLILGEEQTYTSYGGILAGFKNTMSKPFASVTGGYANTASGEFSSVSGGRENKASGSTSSVSGGQANSATNTYSSVSGGLENVASGFASSLSGGLDNTSSSFESSVSGGELNNAKASQAWVGGGSKNVAKAEWSAIFGGKGLETKIEYEAIP